MKILVTGGLGYIGSHTIVELCKSNHEVIVVDNLVNSKIEVLEKLEKITNKKILFYEIDITDEKKFEKVFIENKIDFVIHFAGLKAVSESVFKPLEYYKNNVFGTIVLCELCKKYEVFNIVFSSSATVYGNQASPIKEEAELMKTTNPYGESKVMIERILTDLSNANEKFCITMLRYFNPVGAHKSGLIGEDPKDIPNNLMPIITKVAKGEIEKLSVFGSDYDTKDGTCIRDFVHICDLAKGHILAIDRNEKGINVYNLGTGRGYTVLELIKSFEKVNDIKINYELTDRRIGDIDICFADVTKANTHLGFECEFGIDDMVKDAWNFAKNN